MQERKLQNNYPYEKYNILLIKIIGKWIQNTHTQLDHFQVGYVLEIQGWFNIYNLINIVHNINKLKN